MPDPGPNFLAAAGGSVESVWQLYTRALTSTTFSLDVEVKPGIRRSVSLVRGHFWGNPKKSVLDADGPVEVMVVGKMPWIEEVIRGQNWVGPSGTYLKNTIAEVFGGNRYARWYVTNVVRYIPPDNSTTLKSSYVADCLPLLYQEILLLKPSVILVAGKESLKAVTRRRQDSIISLTGSVLPQGFCVGRDGQWSHECLVVPVLHPAEALRDTAKSSIFVAGIKSLKSCLDGQTQPRPPVDLSRFCVLRTQSEAKQWMDRVEQRLADLPVSERFVALDCEWHGRNPYRPNSYVRTIQLACDGEAAVLRIAEPGGRYAWDRPIVDLIGLLSKFLRGKRPLGHFLLADAVWLAYLGLDIFKVCPVALSSENGKSPWQLLAEGRGYWDTAYAAHAIEETAGQNALGLDVVALRYAGVSNYCHDLESWLSTHKDESRDGYGLVPDEILFPYAAADVLVLDPIRKAQQAKLDSDAYGNNCWQPFWESLLVQPVMLEMCSRGISLDSGRLYILRDLFLRKRDELLNKLRLWAKWPEFNPRSPLQVRELLFGDNNGQRRRPEGAGTMGLQPVSTTGKSSKPWSELEDEFELECATPSTDKGVLEILYHQDHPYREQIGWLRDFRFLDQALKGTLSDGCNKSSLEDAIDCDGRVRTRLSCTTKTGRWQSSQPNLQNLSKDRDADYERIIGKEYSNCRIRSVLQADPGGCLPVIVKDEGLEWMAQAANPIYKPSGSKKAYIEFDIVGAELHVMAVLSGDETMIEHAERSGLPTSGFDENGNPVPGGKHPHPLYYDIHSHMAVNAFKLDCPPNKKALEHNGLIRYRHVSKIVVFAMCYGAEPEGIVQQSKRRGVEITTEEVNRVREAYFAGYPKLEQFYSEARQRVVNHGWIANAFGRYRRFSRHEKDDAVIREWQREAMNFPVQSTVASAVNRGLAWLQYAIEKVGLKDRVCLLMQQHDAVHLECEVPYVEYVVDSLLPWAFKTKVPLYSVDLSGRVRRNVKPSYFNLEVKVYKRWGEPFSTEECLQLGIPERFALD